MMFRVISTIDIPECESQEEAIQFVKNQLDGSDVYLRFIEAWPITSYGDEDDELP
jgi:hypothetical protein